MDRFFHRAENICKKRLIPLALTCAMLISAAPLQAMALEEKPAEQTAVSLAADNPDDRTLVRNWGFESGDLSDWTVLTPGWGAGEQGSPTGVISARSDGANGKPTNQSGSYHLSGLHNGIPGAEGWSIRSSSFLLSGSGWISVKMGGQAAAVKVFLADGTQVGYYRSQGSSSDSMATYVIDLSEYLGREMYVVLCDEVIEGSSANALFDDVITCYDAAPDPTFRFDTVVDGYEVRIPWVMGYNLFKQCTENDVKNGGFESGNLTGWTVLTEGFDASGAVVNARNYWAQELPYNQSGFYHLNGWNTGIPEEQGWAVRSSSFVLGGSGYISVKMGGNAAVTKVFLSDGTQIGYYRNFRFRDVSFPYIAKGGAWCDMATYVIDLSDYLGKEMYIELHDEVITDGWANAFFDDVVTYYETAPDASQRYDNVPDGHMPGETARLTRIPWVTVPKVSTEAARQIPNGDFETGDLTGWTIYGSGFPIQNGLPAASSAETYWEQELPFNKSGSYFLNGWDLSGNEASTWRVRSAPFTLEGSGWISVKMGGHAAAVRVYRMDGTLVGDFDQSRFCDKEFPHISKGGSWCDMATYLLDLTPNLGEVLYIELCDIPIDGGWANAFFDDVVTYYAVKPTAKTQTVTDGHKPGEKAKQVKISSVVGVNNLYNPRNNGFEMGSLTGWTVVDGSVRTSTAVVAAIDYNLDKLDKNPPEYRKLPYNTSGNHLLSGHDATQSDEDATWVIRSSPFTLAGSGYISVKMGGHSAAFRVRNAENNKVLGYCQQRRFNDVNFPHNSMGGSWRDMATYVMDLSPYLGQKLVVELMDEEVGEAGVNDWKEAYFDEIVTYYPKRPTTVSDTVTGGYIEGVEEPEDFEILWIYLDAYKGTTGRFPPSTTELTPVKDFSCERDVGDTVSLYDVFTTEQGLSGYDLEASSLTITAVKFYKMDSDGKMVSSKVGSNKYTSLTIEEGCYVAEYQFKQAEKTFTGKFSVTALPEHTGSQIFNGGFEAGTMAGWTVLTGENFDAGTAVISDKTYWGEELPYNQAGKYHLDGWKTGVDESKSWSVRSTSFTLNGTGYISWRMGGNAAALSVHRASDGKELVFVEETRFNDANFPDVSKGSWADMATYVLDLSAFVGEDLYIVLHDTGGGKWANAFFDEVVTCYETEPELNQKDIVQNSKPLKKAEVSIPWVYVKVQDKLQVEAPFKFTNVPKEQTLDTASAGAKTVNLVAMLEATTATYEGETVEKIEITKVLLNGVEYTGSSARKAREAGPDYTSFDMSQPGEYTIIFRAYAGEKWSWEMSFTIKATGSLVINGDFETGDLSGWTTFGDQFNKDDAVINAQTYWGEELPYNQGGDYHLDGWNTGIDEGNTWSVRSSTFTLRGSGWISVKMGGHAAAVKVFLADGTQVGYYKQTRFNDASFPHVAQGGSWADMATYVMDLHEYIGKELYIELHDEPANGWANAFFDDVIAYYAEAPDYETMKDQVTDGHNADETAGTVDIPWQKADNLFNPAPDGAQVTNGGFETGNLTGWEQVEGEFTKTPVISAQTYWGEKMPYNQAGNYHLNGMEDNTGIPESGKWAVRSSTFTLQGSGYISVRMGGHAAAVKVYKADGTLVGYYKQNRYSNPGFPNVELGSWADMATYVMDLSEFKGQEMYIELCDEGDADGWALGFFDEVVTYYKDAPDYGSKVDYVANGAGAKPDTASIPWRLVKSEELDTASLQMDEIEADSDAEDEAPVMEKATAAPVDETIPEAGPDVEEQPGEPADEEKTEVESGENDEAKPEEQPGEPADEEKAEAEPGENDEAKPEEQPGEPADEEKTEAEPEENDGAKPEEQPGEPADEEKTEAEPGENDEAKPEEQPGENDETA